MIIAAVAAIATMAFLGTLATFATPALIGIGIGALSCCCLGGYFINRGCSLKQQQIKNDRNARLLEGANDPMYVEDIDYQEGPSAPPIADAVDERLMSYYSYDLENRGGGKDMGYICGWTHESVIR